MGGSLLAVGFPTAKEVSVSVIEVEECAQPRIWDASESNSTRELSGKKQARLSTLFGF